MTGGLNLKEMIAGTLVLVFFGLPVSEVVAQSRGGNNRSSVRQSNKSRPAARPPSRPPAKPPSRPPSRPPSYHPPRPRPPAYRPPPPRYRGSYYRSYDVWRLAVGTAAVIAIGTILATPPPQATTVIVQERTYYVHDGVYYEEVLQGDEVVYQVVPKP